MRGRSSDLLFVRALGLVLGLTGALLLAGCGDTGQPDGGGDQDGCTTDGARLLSVVGNPSFVLYPGDQVELKVVFLQKCLGAVAGEQVEFQITSNPGDSSLDAAAATTEATGLAKVTLTAGEHTGRFQVWAHNNDDPEGVYFSIDLKPVIRELQIVGNASLEAYIGETVDLTVKVMNLGTNLPVRSMNVSFAIAATPGDASLSTNQVATNLSGLATTTFRTGTQIMSYQVNVEGTQDSIGSVRFTINVKEKSVCTTDADCQAGFKCLDGICVPQVGDECESDDECHEGYICVEGYCRPEGVLPDSCTTSEECPEGYFCEQNQCYPCPEESPLPECENTDPNCLTDEDCPPGFICLNGVCVPDNPENAVIPDLSGYWYTQHYFDIHNSLPGFAQTMQGIISFLNQAINYCDITGIGFVDDMICDLIDDYIPDWVGTLISILDNLGQMLSELRAEGEMQLNHLNPPELLSGSELWDKILIRYLDACCEGQPAGCNPYQQPNFPDCAAIDIYREDMEYADVGLEVLPFTAKVQVTEGVIDTYTLAVDPRQVRIEVKKFVLFLVDLLVQIFLGYEDLDEALMDLIDCEAIQDLVDDILGDWAPNIVQACENLKPNASQLLQGLLNSIAVDWSVLNFSGWATLTVDDGYDPPYGTNLGFTNFEERDPRDGFWSGTFQVIVEGDITGGWYAER